MHPFYQDTIRLEDSTMHRAGQSSPPGPPSLPSQQNKVILQREYREKEGECFNTLRDVLKDLTGEELRTRQEILRKAIDLLLAVSEMRKQSEAQAGGLTPCETPSSTTSEEMTSSHVGYSTQSPHLPQSWQSNAECDAPIPYYDTHFHDQQYHFMSGTDSAFNQASAPGYGEDWSNYPQL